MFLTLYDLDNIKKNCDNLSKLVTEIKHVYNPDNIQRQLFVSRDDYNESLKVKNEIPQDFYYIRLFDSFVQIVYNKQTQYYQIYLEGFYTPTLNKYKKLQRNKNSYIISQDFDTTYLVFKQVVEELIESKVLQSGLF